MKQRQLDPRAEKPPQAEWLDGATICAVTPVAPAPRQQRHLCQKTASRAAPDQRADQPAERRANPTFTEGENRSPSMRNLDSRPAREAHQGRRQIDVIDRQAVCTRLRRDKHA